MPLDGWIELLNTVGATFWRGFPYDITAFLAFALGYKITKSKWILGIAVFMAILIALNLTVATVPAWGELTTF